MKKYILSNDTVAIATEIYMNGMAGESMSILEFRDAAGKVLSNLDVFNKLHISDAAEVGEWVDMLSKANHQSAISFCR